MLRLAEMKRSGEYMNGNIAGVAVRKITITPFFCKGRHE